MAQVGRYHIEIKIPCGQRAAAWAFGALGFVALVALFFTGFFVLWRIVDAPRPEVITKTVTISALTAAQQQYIKECEQNTETAPGDNVNNGIPDIHTNNWSCSYAH